MKKNPGRASLLAVGGVVAALLGLSFRVQGETAPLGAFESQGAVGRPSRPGSARLDVASGTYLVSGGGANIWFTNDDCHYVWKRASGDVSLAAAVEWVKGGGNAHRKACLMIRQDLAPDSPYVDVAVHGDGLISLQFRAERGGTTREVQARGARKANGSSATTTSPAPADNAPNLWPVRVGLVRQGEVFFATLPGPKGEPEVAGAWTRLKLADPVYIGLAVCAHDDQALEAARFSNVTLGTNRATMGKPVLHCALEVIPIGSRDRRVVYHTTNHIEAPNWSHDGRFFLFNSQGRIWRLPTQGGNPEPVNTGFATRCNNDHGLSPDGTRLAISDQSRDGKSLVYTLPSTGGEPRLITPLGPSYWHGWSPDGKALAYCAERNGEFDVYTIPAAGGEERRLTTAKGLDDGPEYSPDGKFIYFNSERSGSMQIWRMKADGSGQEQITNDEFNNWFPHPSPDGKWIVFLSYEKDVKGHPAIQPVRLRLVAPNGGPVQELTRLFGGQGTINVPSWSPDSREVAFVSYELLVEPEASYSRPTAR